MYPLIFKPDFKERVWGGEKLKTFLNKDIPNEHTGESWEIACHNHGQSRVLNGELAGKTLEEVLLLHGREIIGKPYCKGDKFPLLIKFIDAKDKLSVQVHPEDAYAFEHEKGELGKSEAWYILQANEGAKLVAGLKGHVTKAIFEEKLQKGQLEDVLNEIEVKAGDVLNIPAGLIHAIGNGILLAEIQQNSDTTYRVYDWGRVGLDGKPRDLHVVKSLDVIDFDGIHSRELVKPMVSRNHDFVVKEYVRNKYFVLQEISIEGQYIGKEEVGFEIYMAVKGNGKLYYDHDLVHIAEGTSFMIPASLDSFTLEPEDEKVVFVKGFIDEKI